MIVHLRYFLLGALIALPVALAAWATAPIVESFHAQSPDGAFIVVARTQPYQSFFAVMPGQGSDKPARVTLYRGTKSCGSAWAAMLHMAREIEWEMDAKPRQLHVKFVADWDLDACAVVHRWQD